MEDWIQITTNSLEGVMSATERDVAATADVSITLPDRAAPVITNLIAEVRAMIATWSPNTLSADAGLIPPGFVAHALVIARHRVITGIEGIEISKERITEYEAAVAFFTLVAKGTIRPQPASDAVPNDVPGETVSGIQVVSAPGSRTGRERMNGI